MLEKMITLFFTQSLTNLPGLAILSLQTLFDSIINFKSQDDISISSVKNVWQEIIYNIIEIVLERKSSIDKINGHIASAHILTFKDSSLKSIHERGSAAADKVENHLFFLVNVTTSQ